MARVGVIVGSLRKGAHTRMLSRALPELTPASLQLVDIDIGELPMYTLEQLADRPPEARDALLLQSDQVFLELPRVELSAAAVATLAGSLTAEMASAESMTAAQSGARTIPRNQTLILARTPTTTPFWS